ncbi:MAG: flavin reductase family protein, partial [Marinirhabdus sp.]
VDALPHNIKNSKVLSGNNLGMLATIGALPTADKINTFVAGVRDTDSYVITSGSEAERHERAKQYLDKGRVTDAWCILLAKPLAGN